MEKAAFPPHPGAHGAVTEKHIMERWQNKTKSHCGGIIGKGLLHSTAPRESGNHLHWDPAGVLNMPPPLPGLSGLSMAFKPNPVPILFGKLCYSLLNIPLQGWDFPQQLQCHIPVTSNTQAVLAG